jgi:hypothetical protein
MFRQFSGIQQLNQQRFGANREFNRQNSFIINQNSQNTVYNQQQFDATMHETEQDIESQIIDLSRTVYNFYLQEPQEQAPSYFEHSHQTQTVEDFFEASNISENDTHCISPKSPYTCHTYTRNFCSICTQKEIGVLLKCCQNKQFICIECYIHILLNCTNKRILTQLMQSTQPDLILEQYCIDCPYCRSKSKLGHCDIIMEHIKKCLEKILRIPK